jgi:hypothetical protein
MLAAQLAAVHMATMTFARRFAHVENIPQQDSAKWTLNKLARRFATQMEALKRYRTGGQQKVTVEHVHAGGQATVGHELTRHPECVRIFCAYCTLHRKAVPRLAAVVQANPALPLLGRFRLRAPPSRVRAETIKNKQNLISASIKA